MRNYEVTFIVDPVLSGDEIKSTAQRYVDLVAKEGTIIHRNDMGLQQLAYPINSRTSGVYTCVEFECESSEWMTEMELQFRRDEKIMRFLTVKLDKFGVKYNNDKREGKIGKIKRVVKEDRDDRGRGRGRGRGRNDNRDRGRSKPQQDRKAKAPVEAKKEAPAPVVEKAAPVEAKKEAPAPVVEKAAPVEAKKEAPAEKAAPTPEATKPAPDAPVVDSAAKKEE